MSGKNAITAIILAGGKSSRMQKDKGLIDFMGNMMIGHVINKVRELTSDIIIITKNPAYLQFGYPCFNDIYPNAGPLGGIFTGLVNSGTEKNLVVGCDTPLLSAALLRSLTERTNDEDVLITVNKGKAEPLFAIYSRKCIPYFEERIKTGKFKVVDALQYVKTTVMNLDYEGWAVGDEFTNFNTPEELKTYILHHSKSGDQYE